MEGIKNLANLKENMPPGDFLILLGIFLLFVGLGFFWSKRRMLVMLFAIYIAGLIAGLVALPSNLADFKIGNFLTGKLLLFWGITLVLFLIFGTRGIFINAEKKKKRNLGDPLKVLLYSIAAGGLFISMSLSMLPEANLNGLSGITHLIFLLTISRLCWIILPLLIMLVAK